MSFNGNGARLVGDDVESYDVAFGAEVLGDGIAALAVGTYLIIKVAGSSGFPPATTGTAPAVGDVIEVVSGVTITPNTDDDVVTLTLTRDCDTTSFAMNFSKDQIEITTVCDLIKKYRAGKADMDGTIEGIFQVGTTDKIDGRLQEFIPIARQDGSTSFDRYAQAEKIRLGIFVTNKNSTLADVMRIIAPYQTYGLDLGGAIGEAQTFSAPFKFAPLTYTSAASVEVAINPTFYRLGS